MQLSPLAARCATALTALVTVMGIALGPTHDASAQAVIFFEDFENDVPDTRPATSDFYAKSSVAPDPSSDPATIVVTGGAFADPFGISGNQSMVLYNPNGTTQQGISWTNEFPDDASMLKNSIIEFDLLMDPLIEGRFWSYLDLRIGHGGPDRSLPQALVIPPDITAWNSFRIQTPNNMFDDGHYYYYGNITTFSDPSAAVLKAGTPIHVKYDMNGNAATYQISIDDQVITWGQDMAMTHPWLFQADLVTPAPGVNMLAFFTAVASGGGAGNVYIDNIKVTDLDASGLMPDLNMDGFVDIFDVNLVSDNWGTSNAAGDANKDGIVDIFDVNVISDNWSPSGGGQAVPEPSACALLILAVAAAGIVSRRCNCQGR